MSRRSHWHLLSISSIHIQLITSLSRNVKSVVPGNSLAISSAVLPIGLGFLKLALKLGDDEIQS